MQAADRSGKLVPQLVEFLQDPLVISLLSVHPNALFSPSFTVPPTWNSWWNWVSSASASGSGETPWASLLQYYTDLALRVNTQKLAHVSSHSAEHDCPASPILPSDLADLLQKAGRLQLDRTPLQLHAPGDHLNAADGRPPQGMSPKKAHEVSRMSEYIHHLTTSVPQFHDVRYIVDVGAGQGYLSRALCDLGFHVLALDGDTGQTEGAKRRDDAKSKGSKPKASQSYAKLPTKGSLTHKTLYINSTTLKDAVSSWIDDPRAAIDRPAPSVLFVALHACGSLTPDIYRAFLDLQRSRNGNTAEKWSPAGAVIVGCCYNLMDAAVDFPLSREFASCPRLTSSHLQLATQMPSHWFDTPTSRASAELAVKKVVYRALLEPFLQASASAQAPDRLNIPPTPSGTEPEPGPEARKARIGRLPDRIYTSFPNFCSHAFTRLGLEPSTHSFDSLPTLSTDENVPMPLAEAQKRLEVLHTLRCILGPCIESLILLDRLAWLRENLCSDSMEEKDAEWDVELVGLFDQALGSARSFALVVVPGEAKPKTGS